MLRGFTDSAGVEWRVWEVFPTTANTLSVAEANSLRSLSTTPFANGWLCFESRSEKRRLAPIPVGWEHRDAPMLQELCAKASIVPARRPPAVALNVSAT
jgi:hypothetical protein